MSRCEQPTRGAAPRTTSWTAGARPSSTRSSPSTSRPPSPSGSATVSRAATRRRCRPRRCAPRWSPSSARGTSPSPTPRRGGSRRTAATGSSSTTSPSPGSSARPAHPGLAVLRPRPRRDGGRARAHELAPRPSSRATPRSSSGPPHATATILSVSAVPLAPRVVLVVVVLDDGAVEKATLELDEDVSDDALAAAGRAARASASRAARSTRSTAAEPDGADRAVDAARRAARSRRCVAIGGAPRARAGLHRRLVEDRRELRRRGDRALGARDPRAAARRRGPPERRARAGGCRSRSARSTATSRSRAAR